MNESIIIQIQFIESSPVSSYILITLLLISYLKNIKDFKNVFCLYFLYYK
jgi:hypothetical protein